MTRATDAIRATPREDVDTKAKCIEDSANANGFAKLRLDTVQAPEPCRRGRRGVRQPDLQLCDLL